MDLHNVFEHQINLSRMNEVRRNSHQPHLRQDESSRQLTIISLATTLVISTLGIVQFANAVIA